jgi:hypothetical protein
MILTVGLALSLAAGIAFADPGQPEPAAPAKGVVEDGKVNVYIGTPRVNGYAIGDSIPITLVFEITPAPASAAPAATTNGAKPTGPTPLAVPMVDVAGLKMQVQTAEASDVEMLAPADSVTRYTRDGKEYLKVVYYVWTFVTTKQTQVAVKADFMYATRALEDGQPDWRKASTPEINIGIRTTATDNQVTLLEGDVALKSSPRAPAAVWMLLLGPLFCLPLFGGIGYIGYRRYMEPKKLNENEVAWAIIDPAIEAATAGDGFTLEHYRSIFSALRHRYGVLALDGKELNEALRKHKDLRAVDFATIEHVFGMEAVFYSKAASVSPEQQKAFVKGIKAILPRH